MTATVTGAPKFALSKPTPEEQAEIRAIPGTLWERVADRSALERAKAAHPAGKGIKREEL